MPSQRPNTSGYLLVSCVKRSVAPSDTYKLTPLFSSTAPVMNSPLGTTTRPPPLPAHSATVLRMASVQSKALSPTAPNRVMSKSRSGKTGGLIRARIRSTSDQGSGAGLGASQRAAPPAMFFRKSRRFVILNRNVGLIQSFSQSQKRKQIV